MPKQKYVANGFFQIKETVISNPDGSVRMTKTTKVTGKGQQYFLNKYLKNKEAVCSGRDHVSAVGKAERRN